MSLIVEISIRTQGDISLHGLSIYFQTQFATFKKKKNNQ